MKRPGFRYGALALVAALAFIVGETGSAHAQAVYDYSVLRSFADPAKDPLANVIQGSDGALYGTTSQGGAHGSGVIFKMATDGSGFTVLHEFNLSDPTNGGSPAAGLIQASDGFLYGSTESGGAHYLGGLYRIATDGSSYATLHDFSLAAADGYPAGRLTQGSDEAFYGTTPFGGENGAGAVFKMATDGTGFTKLHDFSPAASDGRQPLAQLIQGADGLLYGATQGGGTDDNGIVFRIGTDGTGFAVVHDFLRADSGYPTAPLIQAADGFLYGTTYVGSPGDPAVVFKVATDGSGFVTIHNFSAVDGDQNRTSLVQAADGALYGTMQLGGAHGRGALFKMATDGTGFERLHDFDVADGALPQPSLIQAADGALYGVTFRGGSGGRGVVFKIGTDGSAFATVHEFEGTDPAHPETTVTRATDGALYGTAHSGGAHDAGTIFRINGDGSAFTKLHDFDGLDPMNGALPMAGIVQAADGLLYGTTYYGGANGYGILYRIADDGSGFTKLHDFDIVTGCFPEGTLTQASDGALYGTTFACGSLSGGAVFHVETDGSGYREVHGLRYSTDGQEPAGVIQGADGALYGTTHSGGPRSKGVIFKVATDGTGFKKLHDFDLSHGGGPSAGLTRGSDDALYGTATDGGTTGRGVVFKLKPDGTGYTVLHNLDYVGGSSPKGVLIQGFDGALYGTTYYGGASGDGVAFRIGVDGTGFTKLHDFGSAAEAANPVAGLVQGTDGALYGTTYYGGSGGGTVFRLATQTLSVSDTSVVEGDTGTAPAVFTVSLAQAGSKVVTVHYATANGTALAGSDDIATSGILTFNPGETSKTVSVMVNGDALYEADETLSLRLSSPVNATLATDEGTATILNDDLAPSMSIGNVSVSEGDIGVKNAVFTVSLSAPSALTTTVQYATSGTGTATPGDDYRSALGTLTFAPGIVSTTIAVRVKGDTTFEPNEEFDVRLSAPVNALIFDDTGVGTIVNDDGAGSFQFSAASYSVSEAMPFAVITVTRVNGKQAGATVDYTTADGSATQPADYAFTHGTLTFAASQASATFRVPIVNDSVPESPKTLLLSLGNPQPTATGAGLGAQGTAVLTIVDNDVAPTIRFSSATYTVSEGAGAVKLTVKRVGALTVPGVSFHYETIPGSATGAGTDYSDGSGDLTFATSGVGATSQTITVPITADAVAEGPEAFTVTLSSPANGILGSPATATVTIANDDATVQFSAGTYAVNEATPKATISVKRTGSLLGTVTVHYSTSDGTATSARYVPTSGDLTFGPGVSVRTFPVSILNDAIDEGTQTVNLTLGPSVTWDLGTPAIGTNPAVLSITDDEPTVQFSAAAYSVSEALNSVLVSVRRTGSLVGTATVHYATSDGSATSADYVPMSGDLTFLSGQAARTFPITLNPDTVADGSRTINLALSAASGVALGTPSTSVVTIRDNDVAGKVQFSAADFSVSERDGSITITVTRSGGTSSEATVDYSTADGAGVEGTDYTASSGTLTFGLNEKARTFTIPILDDGTANPGVAKDVVLTLGSPGNGLALGAPSSATLWILKE